MTKRRKCQGCGGVMRRAFTQKPKPGPRGWSSIPVLRCGECGETVVQVVSG